MKRKIIDINEGKCTGCGQCIPDCPEGALQLIDGKARLVSDLFCDGLGACIGTCPEGAITVIEREAGIYDEKAVMDNIVRQGPGVITAHLEHLLTHGEKALYNQAIDYLEEHHVPIPPHRGRGGSRLDTTPGAFEAPEARGPATGRIQHRLPGRSPEQASSGHLPFAACPGSAARSILRAPHAGCQPGDQQIPGKTRSELRQWPIQLALLDPHASYFDDADLLIAADCIPFAFADFHRDFLEGRIVIIFCPKLDADIERYITKMADIFSLHRINSITILHMEVPCCSGVVYIVSKALERSQKDFPVREFTVTIDGRILPGR
jgi:NAD-dependent dihydropyrimidine dehydrogenase PreA subunit